MLMTLQLDRKMMIVLMAVTLLLLAAALYWALAQTALVQVAGLAIDDPALLPRLFSPWGIDANSIRF